MNQVCRDIFRAIHEGKWLKIEYRNKSEQVTRYWIGILDLDSRNRMLRVNGLHVGLCTIEELKIYITLLLLPLFLEIKSYKLLKNGKQVGGTIYLILAIVCAVIYVWVIGDLVNR